MRHLATFIAAVMLVSAMVVSSVPAGVFAKRLASIDSASGIGYRLAVCQSPSNPCGIRAMGLPFTLLAEAHVMGRSTDGATRVRLPVGDV